jgi:hypothetical protein
VCGCPLYEHNLETEVGAAQRDVAGRWRFAGGFDEQLLASVYDRTMATGWAR